MTSENITTKEDLIEIAESSKILDVERGLFQGTELLDELLVEASDIDIIVPFEKMGEIYVNSRRPSGSSESGFIYLHYPDIEYWIFLLPTISYDCSGGRAIGYSLFSDGINEGGLYTVKRLKGDLHIKFVIYDAGKNEVRGVHVGLDKKAYEKLRNRILGKRVADKLSIFWPEHDPLLPKGGFQPFPNYKKFIEENAEDRVYRAFLNKLKS